MFKVFQYNKDYEFSLTGEYSYKKKVVQNSLSDILVDIDGADYCYDRIWLGLLTHYEVNLPISELCKIGFVKNTSRVLNIKCSHLMIFNEPIVIGDGFRIIPGFTKFAINKQGVVKSLYKGKILKESLNFYGYPQVNIYDADKTRWRTVAVHILLARTFIRNIDPGTLSFVNHKNGNKTDYRLSNLEWCSSKANNSHAVSEGLRSDNSECKLKDMVTGEIKSFSSMSNALLSIGLNRCKNVFKIFNNNPVPRLLKNRFELKLKDDDGPWYYDGKDLSDKKLFTISGPYQAKNINNDLVIEAESLSDLSNKTKVSADVIASLFKQREVKSHSGFIFRQKSNSDWPSNVSESIFHSKRDFRLVNNETREVKIFNSLRQTMLFLGIDKRTLKKRLLSNKLYRSWKITEIL